MSKEPPQGNHENRLAILHSLTQTASVQCITLGSWLPPWRSDWCVKHVRMIPKPRTNQDFIEVSTAASQNAQPDQRSQVNELTSRSSFSRLCAVFQPGGKGSSVHSNMGSPKYYWPSESTLDYQLLKLSDFSLSFLSVEQPILDSQPVEPGQNVASQFIVDAESANRTPSVTPNYNLSEDRAPSNWTNESCSDHYSAWTEISDFNSRIANLGHDFSSLLFPNPGIVDSSQHEGDFTFFQMNAVGIGEQFAWYEFLELIMIVPNMTANPALILDPSWERLSVSSKGFPSISDAGNKPHFKLRTGMSVRAETAV